ncbi:hypothetical protein OE88DRAFT_1653353 [Heliocybe sulcata]|uniref:Uncharacterized protein n=1 Tax=Heliocybe sulcata TaxID=5364 RepID=A0A5C3NCV6_9AGAM|nr:hypothetical protein OE88DRAFT_1653353 [Heliocybe sulcata]
MIIDSKSAEAGAGELAPPPPYIPTSTNGPPSQPSPSYAGHIPETQAGRHPRPRQGVIQHGRDISLASVPSPTAHSIASPQLSPEMQEAAIGSQYQQRSALLLVLARCARGDHDATTSYGAGGIITAVICFPIGLLCLAADKEVKCTRCGVRLE